MEFNPVHFCNAFIYFLYMNFGEGDYETFRDDLRDGDTTVVGVQKSLPFFNSFIENFADGSLGKEKEHDAIIEKLRFDIFRKYEPQPIELEIQV